MFHVKHVREFQNIRGLRSSDVNFFNGVVSRRCKFRAQ